MKIIDTKRVASQTLDGRPGVTNLYLVQVGNVYYLRSNLQFVGKFKSYEKALAAFNSF